jgi:hypothetical protein
MANSADNQRPILFPIVEPQAIDFLALGDLSRNRVDPLLGGSEQVPEERL